MLQVSARSRHAKEILAFLLILAVLCALLAPAHRHIRGMFASFEGALRGAIRSELGIDISFDSASPNIFKGLVLYNVSVSSAEDGTEILRADRVAVSLRLLKLLQGDFFNCIRRVSVEGGALDIAAAGGGELLAASRAESGDAGGAFPLADFSEAAESMVSGAASAARRLFASDFELNASNFDIKARAAGSDISLHVGKAGVEVGQESLTVNSDLSLRMRRLSDGQGRQDGEGEGHSGSLVADFSLSGELASDLSSGFASLSVDSIGIGNIYLSRIGLVAGLQDDVISIASMQEGQALALSMTVDTKGKPPKAPFRARTCSFLACFRRTGMRTLPFKTRRFPGQLLLLGRGKKAFSMRRTAAWLSPREPLIQAAASLPLAFLETKAART